MLSNTVQMANLRRNKYASPSSVVKIAAGPSGEGNYEQTLAKLGLAVIQSRVAVLMPYMKGFQLLEMSDDGQFACGFFVFDVNGSIIDLPLFMLKGKLKGKELMFLRDRGAFLPGREGMVKYMISTREQSLGKPSGGQRETRNLRATPNVDVFSGANQFLQKLSSYPSFTTHWGRQSGVFESYRSIYADPRSQAAIANAQAGRIGSCNIADLLPIPGMAEKLASLCRHSPKLNERVTRKLGSNWCQKVLDDRKLRQGGIQLGNRLTLKTASLGLSPQLQTVTPISKLAYWPTVPSFVKPDDWSDAVDEVLELGGYFVDGRPATETKKAMRVVKDETWSGPTENGIYDVPVSGGDTLECVVFLSHNLLGDYNHRGCLVAEKGGDGALRSSASELAVKLPNDEVQPIDAWDDWWKALPEVGELKIDEDKLFVIVDKFGKASIPLLSRGSNGDGALDISQAYCEHRSSLDSERRRWGWSGLSYPSVAQDVNLARIVETGDHLELSQTDTYSAELLVPKSARVFYLTAKPDDKKQDDCCMPCSNHPSVKRLAIVPLSDMDLEIVDKLTRKVGSYTVSQIADGVYRVDGAELVKSKAVYALMTHRLLSKQAAIDVLRQCELGESSKRFISVDNLSDVPLWRLTTEEGRKLAGVYRPSDQPNYSFDFPEQARGQSDTMIPVSEQYPIETRESAPMQYADRDSPDYAGVMSPYNEPIESGTPSRQGGGGDLAVAGQLANQPEPLWENALFTAMVRNVRIDSQATRQIESLFDNCDVCGRTLFLLYAHQDAFADRYGEKDLDELEEQLLTLFEASGDLLVDLLQKAVDPSVDMSLISAENL